MASESKLIENLVLVRCKIDTAARRSGRTADDITFVAVTKYVTSDIVRQLVAAGCRDLGESRPQQLWSNAEVLGDLAGDNTSIHFGSVESPIRWHLIGHLQRNKIQRTLPVVSLIHSGDSMRLLDAVDQAASRLNRRAAMLIEVNISSDTTKHGFKPDEVEPVFAKIAALSSLQIRGLMCMASREGDLDQARREFAALRELRDRLRPMAPPTIVLQELSMGMSGDFEVAIEEGATMVRIGSALFEGIAQSS
jgi:pyridoxal phosphate enzyme (YggS family)